MIISQSQKMGSCSRCISQWFFIILILIIFPYSIRAQQSSNRNVTPGASIVANNADASLTWTTSPSGEFAIGFKQVAPAAFLLAIWFDQIPEKTLVWSANRDNPASTGSIAQLSADGALELIDQRGRRIWDSNSLNGAGEVAHGAMLDTGNFVIAGNNRFLWQSFDAPTDTLLPGQTLSRGGVLVSSFSESNYSRGRFKLTTGGDLGLYTRNVPWDDSVYPYWLQGLDSLPAGIKLVFNQSGYIYRASENGTGVGSPFNGGVPVRDYRQRLTLEYDGVLRHYVHPKRENSTGGREMAWSVHEFIPPNICIGVIGGQNGGGVCGFNSLCSMGSRTDGKAVCDCPASYSLIDPSDRLSGCKPNFALQSCDDDDDGQQFEFVEFQNTNWPYSDYSSFPVADEDSCRRDCLADCFCAVATYTDGRCWKKPLPFVNGRTHPSIAEKALVKIRKKSNATLANPTTPNSTTRGAKSKSTTLIITASVLMAASFLLFLLSSLLLFLFCFHRRKAYSKIQTLPLHPAGCTTLRRFSFKELQEATNGFEDELGRGACSTVYKGTLKQISSDDNGRVVAVKRLDKIAREAELEFVAEVSSISRTNHKNLVQLLGYCNQGVHRILVYEFMRNGSLSDFLFPTENAAKPNWYRRVQIGFEIARGLCYLHEECSTQIIHCDIKPQNVLLDEFYAPKIADFGLAKLMRPDQTRTTTGIRGTRGYVAPEWFRNMPVTVKVDVYSFGILLLELVCCRRNYEANVEDEGEVILADWAYDCYQQGELSVLVANDEEAKSDMKMVERLAMTAIWCIQEDSTMRPHMKRVMHMLEGSIQVPAPPDPTTFIT